MLKKLITYAALSFILFTGADARDLGLNTQMIKAGGFGRSADVANPYVTNRTHLKSNVWLTIYNWGYFGNDSYPGGYTMPAYPGVWAPQCEFPGGSGVQYLFMGSLWIGALVQEEGYEYPRTSTGNEGWFNQNEFFPGEGSQYNIEERSTRPNEWNRLGNFVSHPLAIAEQDFICDYADTLIDANWVSSDPVDGPHFPLGIKIFHKSYSWTYNYAQDFILIDYEIENIASNYLKNLYVSLYVDSDVGLYNEGSRYEDDICGFQEYYYFTRPDGTPDSVRINVAYIADNDGRPNNVSSGTDFTCPAVSGTRVVRAPNPRLKTAFNWWISNGNRDLDFGPSWVVDGSGGWTNDYGTPVGDERKYFVMSNKEFDYDQVFVDDPDYINVNPQVLVYWNPATSVTDTTTHYWKSTANLGNRVDLADGYDTRYLISWGPLGVFDHTDEAGNDIFRLNPGEKFHMTLAYVCGDNFHDKNNPQVSATDIDPDKFNFADLKYNAAWAAWVYDNPMVDTPVYDYGVDGIPGTNDEGEGDGILDTGDGWYGEDTGSDSLFALIPPGQDSVEVYYFGQYMGVYYGPDADGTEMNGQLDPGEDDWPGPEYFYTEKHGTLDLGFMRGNNILDQGDGIPDFQGPPPPPVPILTCTIGDSSITLHWTKYPSEEVTYQDPFSRQQDFEGYKIYMSNTGLENEYSLIDDFDRVDFAYFSENDSLATYPDTRTNAPADTVINEIHLFRKPVGNNRGLHSIYSESDSSYSYTFNNVHPLFPRWYCVTAYDYGDPQSGTEPLETARNSNALYLAPYGSPAKKVMVVPNPYRAYEDYTMNYSFSTLDSSDGLRWEDQDDMAQEFIPESDRRLEFFNLPLQCMIRIFTVAGDLVAVIPHNISGDDNTSGWVSDHSEGWDLNSRNQQQVAAGLYLFSVEDYTPANKGKMQTGKFVIIR
ncbi:hypothetical protein ISS30_01530 [bacterium]|nr:hypothetical protein [bacterium]